VKFLLDTNAVIALLKGHPGVQARIRQHRPGDFAMSAIVAHELYFGAYRGTRGVENLARVDALRFEVLDFDREDARNAGQLRAVLAAAGAPIGPYGLTLITRNVREFGRITAIRVEDWETDVPP
jgi:tRNA(fMet)-specific endonuclease VapC